MKLSVWETETIIKILTPAHCPITKASDNSHFHSSHFFALYFPSQFQWFFLILEIKNNCVQIHYTTRTAPRVVRSTKLSLFCGIRTWMGDQKRIPRVVITSFFSFPFEGDIKDCRTTDSNKIEVIVLDDQKSRELRRIRTTGLNVFYSILLPLRFYTISS